MPLRPAPHLIRTTYRSCLQHDQLTNAAALAFFFLLSLSPLLIFVVSLVVLLPIPDLPRQILEAASQVVPGDAMKIVEQLLISAFDNARRVLSLSILGAVWAGSSGFTAMIVALNRAYLASEARPLWKRQLVAIALTVVVGAMFISALVLLLLGAWVGHWLARHVGVDSLLLASWPYIRWLVIVGFTTLSIEMLYFMAPNVKQRFLRQVPGAALAGGLWLASSLILQWYLGSFAQFTAIYSTLGTMIALMLWFYFTSLAILIGAELNAQMIHTR